MKEPQISVVMSVYNGAAELRETIKSILSQDGVDFEFIIVNDGSTDNSGDILSEYAERDKRIRVVEQENRGLTMALIRGCSEAKGEYIARHDAGDISFPERFKKQLSHIKRYPDSSLVSCGTRFVGPRGEHLYDAIQNQDIASSDLLTLEVDKIRGPSHHGSTLFPKKLYELVGGYRPEFYFAQDLDLWTRLIEKGKHVVVPEILYQAAFTDGAVSGRYRKYQLSTTTIILECARLRRKGIDETPALKKAAEIRPAESGGGSRLDRARALYFIGSCLRRQANPAATTYFREAFRAFPLHLRAAVRMLLE
jgi:hypothetical protein